MCDGVLLTAPGWFFDCEASFALAMLFVFVRFFVLFAGISRSSTQRATTNVNVLSRWHHTCSQPTPQNNG